MPIYTSKCNQCRAAYTYVRRVVNRNETPECCGALSEKQLDTPQVGAFSTKCSGGFVATATKTPTWVEGASDVKRYMKENGLIPHGEGVDRAQDAVRNREIEQDKALEVAVDAALDAHGI